MTNLTDRPERGGKTILPSLCRERMIIAIVLAAGMSIAFACYRNNDASGIAPLDYEAMKVDWHKCADVVVAGDSRVQFGIAPAGIGESMPGMQILNYGFNGAGWSDEYLRYIRNLLVDDSKGKTIILGITPESLTQRAHDRNDFINYKERSPSERFLDTELGWFLYYCRPNGWVELLHALRPDSAPPTRGFREYFRDGWVGAENRPHRPRGLISRYAVAFKNGGVTPESIRRVAQFARECSRQGIEVYALRMPTSVEMVNVENRAAGFDEQAFVRQFEAAGGVWLPFEQGAYKSYDGSHLLRAEAMRFSRELGRRIVAAREERRASAPR